MNLEAEVTDIGNELARLCQRVADIEAREMPSLSSYTGDQLPPDWIDDQSDPLPLLETDSLKALRAEVKSLRDEVHRNNVERTDLMNRLNGH